ncbi:MAG: hypothetical protein IKS61_01035 [Aeriscardovia sp.]|nr:hypothetical protein [Aeriscardovia sp.]
MGKSESEIWKEIWSMKPEKEGLAPERMKVALDLLGRPEGLFKSVLVLGRGRRPASRLLYSLLCSYGIPSGLFSSGAQSLGECIGARGKGVEEKRLSDLFGELENFLFLAKERFESEGLGKMGPMEALLCLAALEFSDEPVDAAVFEVGPGEGFEAYLPLGAEGCLFTPLPEGAPVPLLAGLVGEKAFAFSSPQEEEAERALRERAQDAGARLLFDGEGMEVSNDLPAVGGQVADLSTPRGLYPQVPIKLFGGFQAHMALLALAAGEGLIGEGRLEEDLVSEAFSTVKVPGSLRPVAQDPLTLASCASSRFEIGLCLDAVEENFRPSLLAAVIVPGARFDPSSLPLLAEASGLVLFVPDPSGKGPDAGELSKFAKESFAPGRALVEGGFAEALQKAREAASSSDGGGAVLCAGGEGAFLEAEKAFRR